LVRITSLSAFLAYDRYTPQGFYPINGTSGLLALAIGLFSTLPIWPPKTGI